LHINDERAIIGEAAAQRDAATVNLWRKSVLDRVFNQWLKQHRRDDRVERGWIKLFHDAQLVAAKAHNFNVEVVVNKTDFLTQSGEGFMAAQQAAQDAGQLDYNVARAVRINAHQRRDRIKGVEKEVGIDLALQRLHPRLQQQALLLLQF